MADDQENPDERQVGSPTQASDPAATPGPPAPASGAAPTPGFFDGPDMGALAKGLAPVKAQETAVMDRVRGETIGQAERDMGVARAAFNATSYSPNDLKPWNQQEQSRKYATDPVQAFGSAGSLFAMVASAFTHAPMEVALNGAAAAMNAVRHNDEQEYQRAYTSWKDNTSLAIKRHQMEREHYQDAIQLMQTNMGVGRAKMEAIAASYNDQKMLFLMRNGMDSEMFDLMKSRASAETQMLTAKEKIEEHGFRWALFQNDPLSQITEDQEPDPIKREGYRLQAARNSGLITGGPNSPQTIAVAQFMHDEAVRTGKPATGEAIAEFWKDNFGYGARPQTPQQILAATIMDDPNLTSEQKVQKLQEVIKQQGRGASGNSDLTTARQKADFAAKKRDELMKPAEEGGKGLSFTDATNQAQKEANQIFQASITANKKDALQAQYGQYKIADTLINRSLKTLETHAMAAGIGGKVTRMAERVENVLGSNKTDREQFERDISQLQLMSTRLLLDQATGKPLSAEADKVNTVIAGLRLGDTTANTIRALKEVKSQFNGMSESLKKRIEGNWSSDTAGQAAPSARQVTGGQPAWRRGVIVQPAQPAQRPAVEIGNVEIEGP